MLNLDLLQTQSFYNNKERTRGNLTVKSDCYIFNITQYNGDDFVTVFFQIYRRNTFSGQIKGEFFGTIKKGNIYDSCGKETIYSNINDSCGKETIFKSRKQLIKALATYDLTDTTKEYIKQAATKINEAVKNEKS